MYTASICARKGRVLKAGHPLNAGTERTEALVDPLVALVDLVDRPDRRLALGAQAGKKHRHPGADVRALHPLAAELGRARHDGAVRVAEGDPRAPRDQLVREERPVSA